MRHADFVCQLEPLVLNVKINMVFSEYKSNKNREDNYEAI